MKLSEAINEFLELRSSKGPRSRKTAARYQSALRIFCLCMHDPEVEDLDLPHVLWYLSELDRLGWKPNGRNLIALSLRKLFEFCNLRGYETINEVLIPLPERQFSIPRVTDLSTFRKLLDQIPKKTNQPHYIRNRAVLLMLWDTGARVGELLSLDVTDLDLKKRTALVKTEKSRGRRPIRQLFWTEQTNDAIKVWLKKKDDLQKLFKFNDPEALFVSISKTGLYDVRGSRMSDRSVAEVMRVLSNQAGLPAVCNAHSIRHSMGRDVIKTLHSNSAVSNILGHSNLDSSYIYTMLFGDDLKEQWSKVMRRRGSPAITPPPAAAGFPRFRRDAVVKGQLRPTVVRTGKYGRYERS